MSLATAWLCHCWAAVSCTLPATSLTSCVVHDNAARISLKGYRYVQRNVLIITGVALQWYAHSMNQRWLNQNMESGVLMIVVSQYTTRTTPAGLYSEKWFLSLWYYSSSELHFSLEPGDKQRRFNRWKTSNHVGLVGNLPHAYRLDDMSEKSLLETPSCGRTTLSFSCRKGDTLQLPIECVALSASAMIEPKTDKTNISNDNFIRNCLYNNDIFCFFLCFVQSICGHHANCKRDWPWWWRDAEAEWRPLGSSKRAVACYAIMKRFRYSPAGPCTHRSFYIASNSWI